MALLAEVFPEDRSSSRYELITCAPTDCGDAEGRATQVRIAEGSLGNVPSLHAVSARDGAYAVVHPVGGTGERKLVLTLCSTARCPEPVALPLGPTSGNDIVDVKIAPDGTVWVLRSEEAVVRLARVEPGASVVTDAQVLKSEAGRDSLHYERGDDFWYSRVLALAVRDDGAPVVLHRDLSDGGIDLLSCDDARCATTTSSRLPGGAARGAELVVDGSGRPVVATVGSGVQLHACTDPACSGMRSGLMSAWLPQRESMGIDFAPFLAVDARGRPAVLVDRQFADAVVVHCLVPRCGL